MPAPHTAVARISALALTRPDGSPLNAPFDRELIDNRAFLSALTESGMTFVPPRFLWTEGTANNNFTIHVGPMAAALIVATERVVRTTPGAETTGDNTNLYSGSAAGNSLWYAVYATPHATSGFVLRLSPFGTEPPDDGLVWSSLDAGYARYAGCFPTNGSGVPIPLRAVGRSYWYRWSAATTTDLRVLSAGGATSWTAVDCSAVVPPTARLARLRLVITPDGSASDFGTVEIRTTGDTTDALAFTVGTSGIVREIVTMELSAARSLEYRVSGGGGGGLEPSVSIYVLGFEEG